MTLVKYAEVEKRRSFTGVYVMSIKEQNGRDLHKSLEKRWLSRVISEKNQQDLVVWVVWI